MSSTSFSPAACADRLARAWLTGETITERGDHFTPPDVASQVLMAGPVLLLYLVSMGLAKWIARSRERQSDRPPR